VKVFFSYWFVAIIGFVVGWVARICVERIGMYYFDQALWRFYEQDEQEKQEVERQLKSTGHL